MSQLRLQSRSEVSGPPATAIPALEQKTSTCPAALLTDSTSFFTWTSCETSQGKNSARPFSISSATALPLASSTSDTAINFVPSLANLRQSARPIPFAPPVTTTVFPLICMPGKIRPFALNLQPSAETRNRGGKQLIYAGIICACRG